MIFQSALNKFKGFLPPLREVLSENGVGSYSRYSGMLIVLATIAWVTYLVLKNHSMPDMEGPTAFIVGGQSQYAANQVKHVVAATKGTTPAPETTPVTEPTPGDNPNVTQS